MFSCFQAIEVYYCEDFYYEDSYQILLKFSLRNLCNTYLNVRILIRVN